MDTIIKINLVLRFLLEITACIAMGMWGWRQGTGWTRWLLSIGTPLLAVVLWGTFAVPNDPSRSGHAPVPIPGVLRLGYECLFFGFASWALYRTMGSHWGWGFAAIVVLHYAIAYQRLFWLIRQ
ncbi:MAG: hypothetical protein CL920_24540 [Deltaproteobacteria bacterium]|nr:hypothetical protein [Deltaproteobacteria bacterium]